MTTNISPALGGAALFTQAGRGTSPGYDAIDRRRAYGGPLQEGVMAATSFEVVQRAAGANLSVDITANAADAGSGVAAYVQGDAVTGQGLYAVPAHTAVINEAIAAAHATLPRVDIVVLEVLDNTHDASGSNLSRVRVITGTASSGATLDNRTGAASLPSSCLLLADVHVPATDTTISNSQIRDRRKWARGAFRRIVRNANGAADGTLNAQYTTTSSTIALIDATNLAPRIECTGVPVRVTLVGEFTGSAITNHYWSPQVDSAGVDGMTSVGVNPGTGAGGLQISVDDTNYRPTPFLQWTFVPSAGSHIIAPAWASGSGTLGLYANAARPCAWIVEEIVKQDAANNQTTTG